MLRTRPWLTSLLFAASCSAAYADQVAAPAQPGPRTALAIAPVKIRAPYDVQVVRDDGETMPTYGMKDRFYVQGNAGDRYIIRITNPTASRVEAVVSVDGLDVIYGENGDLGKRGYVVPAYGETRIEGFRTSTDDVATFRFSSVNGSYAGQKGKARNVGVIAVALFEEQAPPPEQQIILGDARPAPTKGRYDYRKDLDDSATRSRGGDLGSYGGVAKADAPQHATPPRRGADKKATAASEPAASRLAPPPSTPTGGAGAPMAPRYYPPTDDEGEAPPPDNYKAPREERLGLGTEFGEQRYSAASYTRFVRAANRPVAIAELRYNDAAGLMALGIQVAPLPDAGEIMTRETADPFPGDRFSRPVR